MPVSIMSLVEEGPVSIEYDLWANRKASYSLSLGLTAKTPGMAPAQDTISREARVSVREQWQTCRIEIRLLRDLSGDRLYELRQWLDGEFLQEQVSLFTQLHWVIAVRDGTLRVDNIVGRKMVPAPTLWRITLDARSGK
jgi:hypothetical protein